MTTLILVGVGCFLAVTLLFAILSTRFNDRTYWIGVGLVSAVPSLCWILAALTSNLLGLIVIIALVGSALLFLAGVLGKLLSRLWKT